MTVAQLGGTAVEDDQVVFRLADPEHGADGVRLWSDLELDADLDLAPVEGGWELRLPRPDLDGLEYMFEIGGSLELDPGNPEVKDGAFGPHSWLALPGYEPPAWLGVEPVESVRRPVRVDRTGARRVEVEVWQPAAAGDADRLPMLVAHDGPEIDRFGELTRYVGAMVAAGELPPMRVGLVAPGARNERYAANPAYARALTSVVVPRLLRLFPSDHRPVLIGQSLGALSALHAAAVAPTTFAGLLLQSGSFFTAEHDPQESGFEHFAAVTGFVSSVHHSEATTFPPIAMTCGTAEENYANNRQLHDSLTRLGADVTWGEARQGHTWTCWRDLFDPHLTTLLQKAWT